MAPPSNLEKAVAERKCELTNFEMIKKRVDDHDTRPLDISMVDFYSKQIERSWDHIVDIHSRLLTADPDEEEDHKLEFSTLFQMMSDLTYELSKIRIDVTPKPIPSFTPTRTRNSDIKLPKINLPTFSGNIQDWLSFRDLFTTAIDNNTSLSDAQKLTYLQSSLTGEAARLIKSFAITDDNYQTAWDIIQNRYENKRELFFAIMRKFMNHPIVTNDNPNALRAMVDATNECCRALDQLNLSDKWDSMLLFLITQKLDPISKQFWELTLKGTDIPFSSDLLDFIEQRARSLTASGVRPTKSSHDSKTHSFHGQSRTPTRQSPSGQGIKCQICDGSHFNFKCPKFNGLTVQERRTVVRDKKLCFNCLRDGHMQSACKSTKTCANCQHRHHSMLHLDEGHRTSSPSIQSFHVQDPAPVQQQTLLATAVVRVKTVTGQALKFRALLDGGSTSSFVTESAMSQLGLRRSSSADVEILGIGATSGGKTRGTVTIDFKPHFDDRFQNKFQVDAYVLNKITHELPVSECDKSSWNYLNTLKLADPNFEIPSTVDLLLGADIFYELVLPGKKVGNPGSPLAVNSKLGWMVTGKTRSASKSIHAYHTLGLEDLLTRFWEVEELPKVKHMTEDEKKCEEHFEKSVTRNLDGRYVVRIPFKDPMVKIGPTKDIALRRFFSLEKKLEKQPPLKKLYSEFMSEYLNMGHMERIPPASLNSSVPRNYFPHHFVLKDWDHLNKFRVVFDGSAKTSTGKSFNDTQLIGPTIQDTLYEILMRFRTNKVAITADISKMYRQILVHPDEQELQCILWRNSTKEPIQEFKLNTITYGTASGPYLATRVLKKLADEESKLYPIGSKILKKDMYMDDCMSGTQDIDSGRIAVQQLRKITDSAKLPLRKFASNFPQVLSDVPPELREEKETLEMDEDSLVKTLGLLWDTRNDTFQFKVHVTSEKQSLTKRVLLSEISKIFDPIGFLSPVIIGTKIMMQEVWKSGSKWDDPVEPVILEKWTHFQDTIKQIELIRVPRCLNAFQNAKLELHGFSDASEKAYAAVIYVRSQSENGSVRVTNLTSKSKVAPVRKLQSLPRLELTGALLLANLMESVQECLDLKFDRTQAWSDSTIVLAWLRSPASRWKTFVANRVSQIQEIIPYELWGHVSGTLNPADSASRGIQPDELLNHPLWWNGPKWLSDKDAIPPPVSKSILDSEEVLSEEKKIVIVAKSIMIETSLLSKCSTLLKLKRVTAWCVRFTNNCRIRIQEKSVPVGPIQKLHSGTLEPEELEYALLLWIKMVQKTEFPINLVSEMTDKRSLKKTRILALCPFWDKSGFLRVGGRIDKSSISYNRKHPLLLPRHHRLTELIIQDAHKNLLHGGAQLVLCVLSNNYWIIRGRDAIRHQIRKCIRCTRSRADTLTQLMGELPTPRVTPARPFTTTGVDYAGPFSLKNQGRSKVTYKAYLSIFVCFVTRAVHLELVSSLSTDAFLAALRRFVSRRGRPSQIYSDNGTNFVGASKELKEMFKLFNSESHNNSISDHLSQDGISWKFNPAGAPHFGGLWESGVKSVKHHLKRVAGNVTLTFEEMSTLFAEIEACLNSRPLSPMSSDPSDLETLTPAHFLIGGSIHSVPSPDLESVKINRLSRWQLVQRLVQDFWKRWATEYLSRLQQRPKWLGVKKDLQPGDLVLVKSDNISPTNWPMARVLSVHPGTDGLIRVVTLKTATGEIKRPIVKLCPLFMESPPESRTPTFNQSGNIYEIADSL